MCLTPDSRMMGGWRGQSGVKPAFSFIYLFIFFFWTDIYLSKHYCVPGVVLRDGNTGKNQKNMVVGLMELTVIYWCITDHLQIEGVNQHLVTLSFVGQKFGYHTEERFTSAPE